MKNNMLNHQKPMVLRPLKNIPESCRKIIRHNEFDEKIMRGSNITKVPIILEVKLFVGW